MTATKAPEVVSAEDAAKARKIKRQATLDAFNDYIAFGTYKLAGFGLVGGGAVDYFVHFTSQSPSLDAKGIGLGLSLLAGSKLRELALKVLKP